MSRQLKRDEIVKGRYESSRFRMRSVDSLFNSVVPGDVLKVSSSYYKEDMVVVQVTSFLIVLESLRLKGVKTAFSKQDYFCGDFKFKKVSDARMSVLG